MRVVQWHGWLLEGSGSNIAAARVTERLRAAGHEVALLCQERHPERHTFVDGWGIVGPEGPSRIERSGAPPAAGRAILLRPEIGPVLPVFVIDEYEGFEEVKRFVDLTDAELDEYLRLNAAALETVVRWHGADAVMVGHAIPGGIVAHRALGAGRYIVKVHGSELEYTIRHQERYLRLAAEGLLGARAVIGPSADVLARTAQLVPESRPLHRVIAPGVDLDAFRPRVRSETLREVATRLDADGAGTHGRPAGMDARVSAALAARDATAVHELALTYDQDAPDAEGADGLRALASCQGPVAGFIGKLLPQKGPHLLIQALALLPSPARALMIGFGQFREWFAAFTLSLDVGDREAAVWVSRSAGLEFELSEPEVRSASGIATRLTFTGRLDHRYAPGAIAGMDVLVVPSVLAEAFGMVAVEGAASGALPLVARHSGLAEIAQVLETAVGRPGLFSFELGPGSVRRLADGLSRLLLLRDEERSELRAAVRACAESTWSWERTARSLLEAATKREVPAPPSRPNTTGR